MSEREVIGYLPVDAGMIYLGDPCYVFGRYDYDDLLGTCWPRTFGGQLANKGGRMERSDRDPEAEKESLSVGDFNGLGFCVSSGYGDGSYPIEVEWSNEGDWGRRVKSVTVTFISDYESEDEDYEDAPWPTEDGYEEAAGMLVEAEYERMYEDENGE